MKSFDRDMFRKLNAAVLLEALEGQRSRRVGDVRGAPAGTQQHPTGHVVAPIAHRLPEYVHAHTGIAQERRRGEPVRPGPDDRHLDLSRDMRRRDHRGRGAGQPARLSQADAPMTQKRHHPRRERQWIRAPQMGAHGPEMGASQLGNRANIPIPDEPPEASDLRIVPPVPVSRLGGCGRELAPAAANRTRLRAAVPRPGRQAQEIRIRGGSCRAWTESAPPPPAARARRCPPTPSPPPRHGPSRSIPAEARSSPRRRPTRPPEATFAGTGSRRGQAAARPPSLPRMREGRPARTRCTSHESPYSRSNRSKRGLVVNHRAPEPAQFSVALEHHVCPTSASRDSRIASRPPARPRARRRRRSPGAGIPAWAASSQQGDLAQAALDDLRRRKADLHIGLDLLAAP